MKNLWLVLVFLGIGSAGVNPTPGASSDNFCIHDIKTVAIVAPRGAIDSGVVMTPRAIVRNVGDFNEVFRVTMQIANGYNQTVQCTLQVGQTDTVTFAPNWIAHPTGTFATVCFTSLAGDQNRRNDTIRGSVEVVACRHDVGVLAIVAPADTVDSGASVTPRAVIRNFGDRQDTFPVTFQVGAVYTRTVERVLAPSQTDTVEFEEWHAGPVGRLATVCFTNLASDRNRGNDTVRSYVDVVRPVRHDVAVAAILDPVGSVDSGTLVVPRAVVTNLGNSSEAFPVTFDIGSHYSETVQSALGAGQSDTVDFPDWVAQPVGTFALECYTSLAGDEDRSNDTARNWVEVLACRHDVGVLAILAPPDTVDSGSVHVPTAVIHNFGDRRETFPVSFRIGTGYAETVQRTLDAGATDTVGRRAGRLARHALLHRTRQ